MLSSQIFYKLKVKIQKLKVLIPNPIKSD